MNKDALKEKISWYKLLFTFSSAVDVALIGWLANNYGQIVKIIMILNILAIICFSSITIITSYKVRKYIKEME